mgnify:CR=1 FL=1
MGIDKFQTWIYNNHYNTIEPYDNGFYNHVYIDINYILHKLISYSPDENTLIKNVIESIHSYFQNGNLKSINLAVDGSANYAKILLQKKRRLLTQKRDDEKLSSIILTTGTQFMNKFDDELKRHMENIKMGENYKNLVINLNLSNNHGESEFKICNFLQKNCQNIFDTHLIVSNDADTILISLSQLYAYNVHILVNIHNHHYTISIDKLTEDIFEEFGYNYLKKLDFVFISLLNGNDYFPKLKYTNIDKLLKIYKETIDKKHTLINLDYSINLILFQKFIFRLLMTIPPKIRYISANELVLTNIDNYFNGLQWCMQLYISGNYPTYKYICETDVIHPMNLFQFLQKCEFNRQYKSIIIKHENYIPISSNQYPLLIMPYSCIDLIPEKYHSIINEKLMYMFEEEFCKKCNAFRAKIKKYSDINKKYNEKINAIRKKYISHRKTHIIKDPVKYIDDIRTIIEDV